MRAYLTQLSILYRNWRIRRLEAKISKLKAKLLRLRTPLRVYPTGQAMGQAMGSIIGQAIGSFVAAGSISSGDPVEMLPNSRVQAYAEDVRDDHAYPTDDQEKHL